MHKTSPFFSIVIPTYNRARYLRGTVNILRRQTFKDFEIIVSDNHSTDETQKMMQTVTDSRLHYFRNARNIGLPDNLYSALQHAAGEYVVTLGDDDFLPFDDSLEKLHAILETVKPGFLRMNWIEKSLGEDTLEKKLLHIHRDIHVSENSLPFSIIKFIFTVNFGGLAGLVFKNTKYLQNRMLHTENGAWFSIVYDSVLKYGGYFAAGMYVIVHWSLPDYRVNDSYESYMVAHGRLNVEPVLNACMRKVSRDEKPVIRKYILSQSVRNLLALKLYTSNRNCRRSIRRLLVLEPSFIFDPGFWGLSLFSLLIPKDVLVAVRQFHHSVADEFTLISGHRGILQRYLYLKKKYYRT